VSNVPQVYDSELEQMRPATQDDIDLFYSNSTVNLLFRKMLDRVLREPDLGKRDRLVNAAMDAIELVDTGPRLVTIDGINLTENCLTPAPMDKSEIRRTLEVCDELLIEAKWEAAHLIEEAQQQAQQIVEGATAAFGCVTRH
jgi:hypothetical protein